MASTPNATILLSVNGGAFQQTSALVPNGQTVPSSATIQLKAQSTVGWQQAAWEIFAFPSGWTPAAGVDWVFDSTKNVWRSTQFQPSLITLPSSALVWGKWITRLIVNNGIGPGVSGVQYSDVGQPLPSQMVDITGAWQTLSQSIGLQDVGLFEGSQFGGFRAWVDAMQKALRALDTGAFGPGGNQNQPFAALLSTTDATPTAFATGGLPYTLADKSACDVIVTIIGKKSASSDVFCQDYRARYYRNGGAVTLIGSVIPGANAVGTGSLSTASATILLSGNTIAPQVTGVAATIITWTCTMQVQPVATAT